MFKLSSIFILCVFLFTICSAEIFFKEEFGSGWENRWVVSKHKTEGAGEFIISPGKYFGDAEADKGLKLAKDSRFYQISAEIKEFSSKKKPLVVQFSVKHEQNIDCGGGYIKLLPAGLDQANFSGDSIYNVMFGPDICGAHKRVQVILYHNGKNHLHKHPEIKAEHDEWTHLYTLILNPDQSYEVLIDNKSVKKGTTIDDWNILPPREIQDPSVTRPADWVDAKEIPDPSAVKPESWDDIPQQIKDKDAKRPDDWDTQLDGEWEPPMTDNPLYKGEWKAPMIPNPAYKGEWVHPKVPNPEFKDDKTIGIYDSHKYIGIEVWQVKAGSIFDNFLVTDSAETASEWAQKTLKTQEGEKAAHKAEEEVKAAEAAKAAEKAKEDNADNGVDAEGEGEDFEDEEGELADHDEL